MSDAEKQRIVAVLNRKYQTTVPVEVMEVAVTYGFTSWDTLRREADEPQC